MFQQILSKETAHSFLNTSNVCIFKFEGGNPIPGGKYV